MSDELRKEIEAGTELKKVDQSELKKAEEDRKKRLAEVEALKEKLKAEGKYTEEEEDV